MSPPPSPSPARPGSPAEAPAPAATGLVGTRIRTRRLAQGVRQADLARAVGISPAYLNLIEHNRRRIGGKLIADLARALGVEPAELSTGPEAMLLARLQEAARRLPEAGAEAARIEEFAGRFPGWAALVAAQHGRQRQLESLVETLSDRLSHDPDLAARLHEILTAVTAIRASVAILAEDGASLAPDWQARFLRNVAEEAERLSRGAGALARFLEAGPGGGARAGARGEARELTPLDEARVWLERLRAEAGPDASPAAADAPALARPWLARRARDAAAMPEAAFARAWAEAGGDPLAVAQHFGVSPARVLQRMAWHPLGAGAALVVCDGAGSFLMRFESPDFPVPRFGGGCPRWPLYEALGAPGRVISRRLEMPGPAGARLQALAVAEQSWPEGLAGPPATEAVMLVMRAGAGGEEAALAVGARCPICPRRGCPARGEPSILTNEAGGDTGGAAPG